MNRPTSLISQANVYVSAYIFSNDTSAIKKTYREKKRFEKTEKNYIYPNFIFITS